MPDPTINSMRALARKLGVSNATVSDALRNNPRVALATRNRVQLAAKKWGYNYNQLAGSVMSQIRRSAVGTYRGTVAIIDIEFEVERPEGALLYHKLLAQGAVETAERLGFKSDFIELRDRQRSIPQLNRMLDARGIQAVLFLPIFGTPSLAGINFDRLTAVYADYLINEPLINKVCPDHSIAMTMALDKLVQLGYRRPGLVLREQQDRRLRYRWEAAFSCYCGHLMNKTALAPLLFNEMDQKLFSDWFCAEEPDVVMAHSVIILDWMLKLGCKVPETHGFCCLNLSLGNTNASGIDLDPRTGGTRAMEALIGQVLRNEFGLPDNLTTLNYPAKWIDGPTLRQQ